MEILNSVSQIREHFPALKQMVHGKNLVYLDNAATAHKPDSVINLINEMNSRINGNIHRAVHELSSQTTALYEASRDTIKNFINAAEREEIVFTSGTTASINLVAYSFAQKYLKRGDRVVISEAEHHSNIVPWQIACEMTGAQLVVIPVDEKGEWNSEYLDKLIDSRVKLVAVSQISNVLGIINPVEEVIDRAHNLGIPVLIDGAQGVVHCKVDVQKMDCDFYVFSGHKLYGPTGTGVLYAKRKWLEQMPPWMGGGDMVETVTFSKTTYAQPPLKFEAGTPNFIGAAGLGEAINFLNKTDRDALEKYEKRLVEYLKNELLTIDGLRIYGESNSKIPLFSLSIEGAYPSDIAMIMDKMGVALRTGQMCCEPLLTRFNVNALLRASFGIYNTYEEAEYFVTSLKRAVKMLR
jgi:cysteine desulfurase / selenocysteine lyase